MLSTSVEGRQFWKMSIKLVTLLDCVLFQSLCTCNMVLRHCLSGLHVYSVVSNQLSVLVGRKLLAQVSIDSHTLHQI